MPQLKIMGFDGVVPRTSATMLQDNQAQVAEDVKLYSKELRYWRGPAVDSYVPPANTVTLYKYYYNSANRRHGRFADLRKQCDNWKLF